MPAFSISEDGQRLLESALVEPRQTFDGRFLQRTIYDKAGALLRSLIKNHPLSDGNKRLGLISTEVFLLINGYLLNATQEERVNFAIEVAKSEPDISVRSVSRWIRTHSISHTSFLEMAEAGLVGQRQAELINGLQQISNELISELEAEMIELKKQISELDTDMQD